MDGGCPRRTFLKAASAGVQGLHPAGELYRSVVPAAEEGVMFTASTKLVHDGGSLGEREWSARSVVHSGEQRNLRIARDSVTVGAWFATQDED